MTAAAAYPSRPAYSLHLDVWEDTLDAGANYHAGGWSLYARHDTNASADTYKLDPQPWGVTIGGESWSGSAPLDFRGVGVGGTITIASGRWDGYGDAAGGFGVGVSCYHNIGSPFGNASASGAFYGQTLYLAPYTPTSVSAVRNSDTQATVSWSNPGGAGGNRGQALSNQVRKRVNGADQGQVADISATSSLILTVAANQKLEFAVAAWNNGGQSAWSGWSAPIFTTPAAPTNVTASKNAALDIIVSFTDNVAYAEHKHRITPQSSTDGGATWVDGAPVDVPAGSTSATFTAPDPSKLWRYQVAAVSTDASSLASAAVTSTVVQLLAPPNKPTLPALNPYQASDRAWPLTWTHNPVDTTPQSAYEVETTRNGVTTTTGKTAATASSKTFPTGTYTPGDTVQVRVRTWGQATTGGSDGTGASPWSDPQTVIFKTSPVASIIAPDGTYTQGTLTVVLGFAQAEGAAFVSAQVSLYQGATLLEQRNTTVLTSTTFDTHVANSGTYTVKATVLDSNGLRSAEANKTFTVDYTDPVPAGVTLTYRDGETQIDVVIPEPGEGQAAAATVSITRTIDGAAETLLDHYPADAALTVIDKTPTIHGDNLYTVTTYSADGAATQVTQVLTTAEERWAYVNTGDDLATRIAFYGDLKWGVTPSRDVTLVQAAGRRYPIALFGDARTMEISGTATLVHGEGSTPEEIEAFVDQADICCYRDPSGRRLFGVFTASLPDRGYAYSSFQYKVTATS